MEDPELSPPPLAMADLLRIIERLRGPDGCPWDREQTARSMVRYLLEEAYELADAVASDAAGNVCEELGDVLFHVLFMAQMHTEAGAFTLADVCRAISDKMTRRHPHVFGSTTVADSDEVVLVQSTATSTVYVEFTVQRNVAEIVAPTPTQPMSKACFMLAKGI